MSSSWLRKLWPRMAAIYQDRWTARMGDAPQYPAKDADGNPHPLAGQMTVFGDTWAKGLAGLNGEQLAHGLEACIVRSTRYVPDLGEFRGLCLGIPSLTAVRNDLKRDALERMPFTRMVWRHIDSFAYRQADARDSERMLREAFAEATEAVMRGEPMPELPAGLLEQGDSRRDKIKKQSSPDVARAALAEISAMLKSKGEGSGNGC